MLWYWHNTIVCSSGWLVVIYNNNTNVYTEYSNYDYYAVVCMYKICNNVVIYHNNNSLRRTNKKRIKPRKKKQNDKKVNSHPDICTVSWKSRLTRCIPVIRIVYTYGGITDGGNSIAEDVGNSRDDWFFCRLYAHSYRDPVVRGHAARAEESRRCPEFSVIRSTTHGKTRRERPLKNNNNYNSEY